MYRCLPSQPTEDEDDGATFGADLDGELEGPTNDIHEVRDQFMETRGDIADDKDDDVASVFSVLSISSG